jgi:flagellar basal body rod protein FlgC
MITGLSAAITGMHRYSQMVDRAAEQVARSGMVSIETHPRYGSAFPPVNDPGAPADDSPIDGLVNMMIAQRMFLASIRVAQTGDEMADAALDMMR